MSKRKARRKKPLKLKLKKKTVYTIFSLGFFLIGVLLLISIIHRSDSTMIINNWAHDKFGSLAILLPFAFFFFGFLFLRLKIYLSQVNVTVGYMLILLSLLSLTKSGVFGQSIFSILKEIITTPGADIVFIGGLLVGTIVFFDTSIDEILEMFSNIGDTFNKLIPRKLFTLTTKSEKTSLDKNKPLTIKGGQKEEMIAPLKENLPPPPKKDQMEILPDKLVSNILAGTTSGVWEYPSPSLLAENPGVKADRGDVNKIASTIEKTLQSFGIDTRVAEANLGPAVTQYALEIAQGTKVSKITSLANDLALATEAPTGQIRIEAPIPGRNLVGLEIPNRSLEVVNLRTMLTSTAMQKTKSKLTVALGLDVSGNPLAVDIAKMPHVLVAGTTGSGKSVLINAFISSLLFRASPQEVRLILIDPKRVEFTVYNGIPHLLTPVIVDPQKILSALKWAMAEMDKRYKLFAERGVRNIDSYNELAGFQALPYIVIFIDELADLMMFAPVEVEDAIARLAQMARATGIHLVIATQRPSVNVITGLIKANIPCRIAFNVSSMVDSRVILDSSGAEKLLGRGDMLYIPPDQAKPTRIQGSFVSDKDIKKLVDFLKARNYPVEYTEEVITQPLPLKKGGPGGTNSDGKDGEIEEAIRLVCQFNTASASFLQRKMSIGYAKAARILDQLEEMGIVSQAEGAKPRDVLVRNAEEFLTNQQQES
ncbi:MAG TPA: DNA translocase FtsK [Candidatus Sulfotelmatobacter sp.]|jgi:S-DNA-T family DNA segregation ATPase FtsK/SpoIIIE|nr:DNA translocase FtsK [Candidatus Sulfotelmatobacter sp.]